MSYYWFNSKEILQKPKKDIMKKSCWVLFTKQRSKKIKLKESIQKFIKRRKKTRLKTKISATDSVQKKKHYKINEFFLFSIKFQKPKQPIDLDLVNVYQIVVSDKFQHSDDDFKYFIGYKKGKIVKPLCIILL